MTMTRERFDTGLTYDQYKKAMSRNRDRVEENERKVVLDAQATRFFGSLPQPVNVVVLAEDWCGDVIANLPVLGRLAQAAPKLKVRIFYRDQNPDLMERWLNQGKYQSIPVFAFFDEEFREIGHWIERPASVSELRAKKRKEIFAKDPAYGSPDGAIDQLPEDVRIRLQAQLQKMRDDTTAFANAEVQRELRQLLAALPVR
jgi:thiol-disulfide isomerase/thioredoxin